MKKMKLTTVACASALMIAGLAGCGQAQTSAIQAPPTDSPQAVTKYQQQVATTVSDIGVQQKVADDLLLQFETHKISYDKFHAGYMSALGKEEQDVTAIESVKTSDASHYQTQFVSLLQSEIKLAQDQGDAYTKNGPDEQKLAQISGELTTFQTQFQAFITAYPNTNTGE